jgi:hypothetical protein
MTGLLPRLPLSVWFLSEVLSPAPNPRFCPHPTLLSPRRPDLILCAIGVCSLSLDPLRTVGSPAAQMRPTSRLKTRATQAPAPLSPISGRAKTALAQIYVLRLSIRCESPDGGAFVTEQDVMYTTRQLNAAMVEEK